MTSAPASQAAELDFAGGYEPVRPEQWMELVQQVLKGAAYERRLVTTTPDGISIGPLYTRRDHAGDRSLPGSPPYTRGSAAPDATDAWEVRQAHSPATGNVAVLADLAGGVDALELHMDTSVDAADLAALLDGVYSGVADPPAVVLAPGSSPPEALTALWERHNVAPGEARGGFGVEATHPDAPAAVALALQWPGVTAAVVNAARLADRGATEAQELAGSLADGVAYLRACEQAGLDVATAAARLEFRYAAGVDQFLTIAKLRAARRLWARVTEVCDASTPQRQHAVTAGFFMSRRDPWVNMVRTTVACFAAAAGGADAITVRPFDSAIGVPDALGYRIARNTQLLLREESHVHHVVDPAGGSYYVEALTRELAELAWQLFSGMEAGTVHLAEHIKQAHTARSQQVATRRLPLTGVSEFPDLHETPVVRPELPEDPDLRRLAEPFEALRDAADAAPQRPTAFLANLGPPAIHNARSGFTANLLAAGGVQPLDNDGFDSPAAAAAAWTTAGAAPVAVVCSSDEVYAEQAAATVAALRSAGCDYVLVAGRDAEKYAADGAVHLGCDALQALQAVHRRFGL